MCFTRRKSPLRSASLRLIRCFECSLHMAWAAARAFHLSDVTPPVDARNAGTNPAAGPGAGVGVRVSLAGGTQGIRTPFTTIVAGCGVGARGGFAGGNSPGSMNCCCSGCEHMATRTNSATVSITACAGTVSSTWIFTQCCHLRTDDRYRGRQPTSPL